MGGCKLCGVLQAAAPQQLLQPWGTANGQWLQCWSTERGGEVVEEGKENRHAADRQAFAMAAAAGRFSSGCGGRQHSGWQHDGAGKVQQRASSNYVVATIDAARPRHTMACLTTGHSQLAAAVVANGVPAEHWVLR